MWFFKKKKKDYIPGKTHCKMCNDEFGSKLSQKIQSHVIEDFCTSCLWDIKNEADRRISFARDCVAKLLSHNGDPYRDKCIGLERAWEIAEKLSQTDPFRKRKYDQFVHIYMHSKD